MCNFCNFDNGNDNMMSSEPIEVVIGGAKLKMPWSLDVGMYRPIESDEGVLLYAELKTDNSDVSAATCTIKLSYCPFCGHELK